MIEKILAYAKKKSCSDIHITVGSPPTLRIDGDIMPIDKAPILNSEQVKSMIHEIMNDQQKQRYKEELEIDFVIQIKDNLRFRVNAFNTLNGPAATFREIPCEIKTLSQLEVPQSIADLTNYESGLILVGGPTGSGKSTTIAGMIDHINANKPKHIITIEDPIEFIHNTKKSLLNQREIGSNTKSFARALKSALREDPDIILVGELRDIETIQLALTAAETGHLVMATLHTSSAFQTVNRVIDVFPSHDKALIRTMLSTSIRGVVSQRLFKKKGGGRCAAFEIMLANSSIRNMIREDRLQQINSIIELNKKSGMCLMKDSIANLLDSGKITQEIADEAINSFDLT